MDQPVPKVSAADVERVITRDFPAPQIAEVRTALGTYGGKSWHREPDRVRLAILKVAGGSLVRLREALAVAVQDYRDVLCVAEYPRYREEVHSKGLHDPALSSAIEDDWKQYRAWFDRETPA